MDNSVNEKHLEFIQNVITRMAGNSFLIKGWSITITSALFALAANNVDVGFIIVALFPVISFWALDAYFLRQERLFRKLYAGVRKSNEIEPFSMETGDFDDQVESWLEVAKSPTLKIFHGTILMVIVIVMFGLLIFK
ncbi:MAG: hypothetical protein U5L07_08535 [Desulfobacterales bacterium]|nr:hypothetical protein [Desulfobacterales bacterium]